MSTQLTYLRGETIRQIEEDKDRRSIEHGFGFARIMYPTGEEPICMIAWIPETNNTVHVWPLYRSGENRPGLNGTTSWQWDGNMEHPTLQPSIRGHCTINGKEIELCHGFVREGRWEPC